MKKIHSYISFISLGLVVVLSACTTPSSGDSQGGNTTASGNFASILAGSSGHAKAYIDSTDHSKDSFSLYFDNDQDGLDDIVIHKKGVDADLNKEFTHTDGTKLQLVKDATGVFTLKVTIPGHQVTTVTEKIEDAADIAVYRGEMGTRVSIFKADDDGIARGQVDTTASNAIPKRLILDRVIFNLIVNPSTRKIKYIVKGLDVDLSTYGYTQKQIDSIKDKLDKHTDETAEGSGSYDASTNEYILNLKNRELGRVKLLPNGDLVQSRFAGVLADSRIFGTAPLRLDAKRQDGTIKKDTSLLVVTFPGEAFINGVKISSRGSYTISTTSQTQQDVTDIPVLSTDTAALASANKRALESYIILRRVK